MEILIFSVAMVACLFPLAWSQIVVEREYRVIRRKISEGWDDISGYEFRRMSAEKAIADYVLRSIEGRAARGLL